MTNRVFNPPPGWPRPPTGWVAPEGWTPDSAWPPAPAGWELWLPAPSAKAEESPTQGPESAVDVPPEEPAANPSPGPPMAAAAPAEGTAPMDRESEGELHRLRSQVALLEKELKRLSVDNPNQAQDLVDLNDERVLQEVGIYRYHHPVENSEEHRERLNVLQERLKDAIKRGDAVLASDMFTFNNSLAKGRKMTSEYSKLMLRAYNSEADSCVRSLRAGNVVTAKKRLDAAVASIAKLGSMMEMRVNPFYHDLRIEELELTADFLMKVQEEKERAREERERLREERKAELELAAERERLDKERAHYANAIEALRASHDEEGLAALGQKLAALDEAIAQNDFRVANIRAGYVYVISNPGAFGHNMVKIGMTRRLEPMERVKELGDASVPFPFDVHALFFSADAVTLENELHRAFSAGRVNRVNERREFFFASPSEVRTILAEKVGNLLEFTETPEATQYLQSKKYWPA